MNQPSEISMNLKYWSCMETTRRRGRLAGVDQESRSKLRELRWELFVAISRILGLPSSMTRHFRP